MKSPNATKPMIDKAIVDKSVHVRMAAIKHPDITRGHLHQMLNDKNPEVRKAVLNHPVTGNHTLDDNGVFHKIIR
jgi:hypothetical protein